MTKSSLVQRLKKYKKNKEISYEALSNYLGYKSPMTSYKWINKKAIPKKQYLFLDSYLKGQGF